MYLFHSKTKKEIKTTLRSRKNSRNHNFTFNQTSVGPSGRLNTAHDKRSYFHDNSITEGSFGVYSSCQNSPLMSSLIIPYYAARNTSQPCRHQRHWLKDLECMYR